MNGVPEFELTNTTGALQQAVKQIQRMMLMHPVAFQAAFRALVAEGRRFANTPTGAEWQQQLRDSELLHRLWPIWETASLSMLDSDDARCMPSGYVDALFTLAGRSDMEAIVRSLVPDGQRDLFP